MTPAINAARANKIAHVVHEYLHDSSATSYGDEAAEKLGLPRERIFKTLVIAVDGKKLAVAVIPVSSMLSMKRIAIAADAKKAAMAAKHDVERSTGYVMGGVSPLGQRKRLLTFIDSSAEKFPTIYVSAGRRGLELELRPDELRILTGGAFAQICQ